MLKAPLTPQARHHFTRADQVDQLVAASEANPERGFMARMMALCSLPRTNPGNQHQYKRVNGPYKLGMTAGIDNKLPFGNYPRLLLAWVSTEAVRTQSRVLVLGASLADFMRELGIYSSGGREGTKLRNQMKRLFGCTVTLIFDTAVTLRFANKGGRGLDSEQSNLLLKVLGSPGRVTQESASEPEPASSDHRPIPHRP